MGKLNKWGIQTAEKWGFLDRRLHFEIFTENSITKDTVTFFIEDLPFFFRDSLSKKIQIAGPGAYRIAAKQHQHLFWGD